MNWKSRMPPPLANGMVNPSAAPTSFQLLKWTRTISEKAMLAMAK